jgi:hypothetical protein
MDMTRFSGSTFLKVDDLRKASRKERIAVVNIGKYDKPDLVFESGKKFSLNATNVEMLINAYGSESDDWVGHVIELHLGQIKYKGDQQDAVLVRPISRSEREAKQLEPVQRKPDLPPASSGTRGSDGRDMDDEIPF